MEGLPRQTRRHVYDPILLEDAADDVNPTDFDEFCETVLDGLPAFRGRSPEECDREKCYTALVRVSNMLYKMTLDEMDMAYRLLQTNPQLQPFRFAVQVCLHRVLGREPACLQCVCRIVAVFSCCGLDCVRDFFDEETITNLLNLFERGPQYLSPSCLAEIPVNVVTDIFVYLCNTLLNLCRFDESVINDALVNRIISAVPNLDFADLVRRQVAALDLVRYVVAYRGAVIEPEVLTAVIQQALNVVVAAGDDGVKRAAVQVLTNCMAANVPVFLSIVGRDHLFNVIKIALDSSFMRLRLAGLGIITRCSYNDDSLKLVFSCVDELLVPLKQRFIDAVEHGQEQDSEFLRSFMEMCLSLLQTDVHDCDFTELFSCSRADEPSVFALLCQLSKNTDVSFTLPCQAMSLLVKGDFCFPSEVKQYLITNDFIENLSKYFDAIPDRRDTITTVLEILRFAENVGGDCRTTIVSAVSQTTLMEQVAKSPEEYADGYDDELCAEIEVLWESLTSVR